jgi:hypothetical protein
MQLPQMPTKNQNKSRTASESVQKHEEIRHGSEGQAHFCTGRVRIKTTRFFFETDPQRSRSTCVHPRPPDQWRRLAQLSLAIMNPMKFPRSSPEPLHSSTPFFSWMTLGLFRSSTPFFSWTNLDLLHSSTYFSWMILVYLHSSTFFSWMCTWASSFIDLLLMDDTFVLLHTSTVFSWMCTWASSFIDLLLMDRYLVLLHSSTFFSWIGRYMCFFIRRTSSHE